MNGGKTKLAVKFLSLAAEARIIKKLEQNRRRNKNLRNDLYLHRTREVRSEARSTHLARGFLKGHNYGEMEMPLRPRDEGHVATKGMTRTYPDFDRIQQLIEKFGIDYFDSKQQLTQQFAEWRDAALGV